MFDTSLLVETLKAGKRGLAMMEDTAVVMPEAAGCDHFAL